MRELINTIAHIGYQVSDLTRSLAFYEPLGFQRQQRFSKPSPQGTIEVAFLEMAGAVLELYQLPAGTPFDAPRCGIDHLALEVSDLDAVQQRLAALGYPLDEGPIEEDNVRFLLIRGPYTADKSSPAYPASAACCHSSAMFSSPGMVCGSARESASRASFRACASCICGVNCSLAMASSFTLT